MSSAATLPHIRAGSVPARSIDMVPEWSRSRAVLEDILGARSTSASVPGGYYSAVVARAARDAGIRVLFTPSRSRTSIPPATCRLSAASPSAAAIRRPRAAARLRLRHGRGRARGPAGTPKGWSNRCWDRCTCALPIGFWPRGPRAGRRDHGIHKTGSARRRGPAAGRHRRSKAPHPVQPAAHRPHVSASPERPRSRVELPPDSTRGRAVHVKSRRQPAGRARRGATWRPHHARPGRHVHGPVPTASEDRAISGS